MSSIDGLPAPVSVADLQRGGCIAGRAWYAATLSVENA